MQTMKMKLGINGGMMGLACLMVAAMALSGCAASSDEADTTLANNSATIVQDDSPPSPPPPPETVAVERNQKVTEDSPERFRTRYREQTRDSSSWTYKKSDKPLPDLTDDKSKQNELFGVKGGGDGTLGHGASRAGSGDGFFGIGAGQAKDIIFVVDRSGSMTDSFMFVKYELIRSISKLEQDRNFHIIFYSSGPGVEMPARKLTSATEANKQKAYDFINGITPEGQTDPSNALDKAFRLEPDVIFLLTDGEFDPEIITQINRLNKEKKVTVNTISFLYTMGEMACMKIADQNNGKYRHVDSDWIRNIGGENKKKHGDATANEAAAEKEPPPIFRIDIKPIEDGKAAEIRLNGVQMVDAAELRDQLKKAVAALTDEQRKAATIFITVERDTWHKHVSPVMTAAMESGIEKVTFLIPD